MWKSAEDVIKDANHTPEWQLILSIMLVSIYSVIAFINIRDLVHSHTMLVLMGMVVVSLSILAGFGLTATVGIKFTPLAGSVVPFLALGLGIDDIFVLVTILRSHLTNPQLESLNRGGSSKPEIEMKLTVALAGPSLVLTTFSILASFFISSVNPMLIVRWFCWQMGITASIHTCGMLLIFIPLMSIDARWVKAGIVDPFLWLFCGLRRKKGVNNDDSKEESNNTIHARQAQKAVRLQGVTGAANSTGCNEKNDNAGSDLKIVDGSDKGIGTQAGDKDSQPRSAYELDRHLNMTSSTHIIKAKKEQCQNKCVQLFGAYSGASLHFSTTTTVTKGFGFSANVYFLSSALAISCVRPICIFRTPHVSFATSAFPFSFPYRIMIYQSAER
jgi:hypothetical protein